MLVGIAEDCNRNEYLQAWTATHLAGFGFQLNGTFAAFYEVMLVALFPKGALPHTVSKRIRRRELDVPNSV